MNVKITKKEFPLVKELERLVREAESENKTWISILTGEQIWYGERSILGQRISVSDAKELIKALKDEEEYLVFQLLHKAS